MEGHLQAVLGNNIRRLRLKAGLSQERFGELIGRHRTYVGALERGEYNVSLRTLERLSMDLRLNPYSLLWDSAYGEMPPGLSLELDEELTARVAAVRDAAAASEDAARAAEDGADPGDESPKKRKPRPRRS